MRTRLPGSVTLTDVAAEAGVSLATASRAFNGSTRMVREDLRERVIAAAQKLNYAPNAPAQAMARGQSNVIGLLVHDIADPYFAAIVAGVMRGADKHDFHVLLGTTMRDPARELEYLSLLRGQRSRAAILAGSRTMNAQHRAALAKEIERFEGSGGHVVMISQAKLSTDTVVLENRAGAKALATELAALGYRRFGVLAGPQDLLTARDRLSGFKDGLNQAGLAPPEITHGDFTRDGGYEAMQVLLDQHPGLDCVFAVNDVMAVGAMAACRDHALQLPRDLGLAGFDDIATLRDVSPGLTTVRIPLEAVGELALSLVVDGGAARPRVRRVKGEVVVRESTPPRG